MPYDTLIEKLLMSFYGDYFNQLFFLVFWVYKQIARRWHTKKLYLKIDALAKMLNNNTRTSPQITDLSLPPLALQTQQKCE